MDSLGRRVRQARDLLGLTREKLAELLQISSEHLAKIELDKGKMSIELLGKMSKTFCVSTDYLLFGRETPNSPNLTLSDMYAGLDDEGREIVEQAIKLTIRALRAGK